MCSASLALFSLVLALVPALAGSSSGQAGAASPSPVSAAQAPPSAHPSGLTRSEAGAFQGYTLFAPLRSTTTYLIDMRGEVVHTWESTLPPGNAVRLLDDGSLLRAGQVDHEHFLGGGQGGRIQRITWAGELAWDYAAAGESHLAHHDFDVLPDGNLLVIAWQRRTREEALAAGRDPELVGEQGLWPDSVLELAPRPPDGAELRWAWHAWEHLIQDRDPAKANYGPVADRPERIDVNGDHRLDRPLGRAELAERAELERQMRATGYVGDGAIDPPDAASPADRRRRHDPADWLHTNSVDHRADLDLIVLSVPRFHELWVIDHSTSAEQARGSAGGRFGRGGDLLYRWGNPRAWGAGDAADQQLYAQHDAQWIEPGLPGAGNLLVFNNGERLSGRPYSSVDELLPPLDPERGFAREPGRAFGPDRPLWSYAAPDRQSFYSSFVSGAQRLPNGNTLVCSGVEGRLFEVTPDGRLVWEYWNPFGGGVGELPGLEPAPDPGAGAPDASVGAPRSGADAPGGANGEPRRAAPTPKALFRATRIAPDHPGLAALRR